MIDHEHEELISTTEACRRFPGQHGRGISLATLWRWIRTGRSGTRLETVRIGGRVYTSREAIQRFVRALNREGAEVVEVGHGTSATTDALLDAVGM